MARPKKSDKPPELPSGNPEESNKFAEYLPSAEYYEAEANTLELLIEREKRRISQELLDEFKRLEYLLSEREKKIALKERELQIREADLNAREARLARQEQFEGASSPKSYDQNDDLSDDLSEEQFEQLIEPSEPGAKKERDYIPNPTGAGGLPGAANSNSVIIDRGVYQGDTVKLENGNSLRWNRDTKEYDFEFIPGPDEKINANRGLRFTYFAVEAAYLNEGYDNPNYGNFYSQTILRKQVWYEKTPKNRNSDGIGEQYQGRVPMQILIDLLNQSLNTRVFTSDGKYIEYQDFRRAYKNWRLKYERGTYYKTSNGDLYSVIEKGSQVNESKGNPPAYRTDGNLRSPSYGQRVNLSTDEKRKWRGG